MKDFKKLQEMDRRMRELAGLYAAERERADSLAEELRSFAKIREHYEHAKTKHPYFCDRLYLSQGMSTKEDMLSYLQSKLRRINQSLAADQECGRLCADLVLNCELVEIEEAIYRDDTAAAVEECYDAIAVLLRVVDVLEGRQALGDPAQKGSEK
jgi:hypothetical protein